MKKISLIGCLIIISTLIALYGVDIAAGGTVTQNFDGLGTSATASMPTDWKVDKNTTVRSVGSYSAAATATELMAGNNMSSSAPNGIYNFAAGDPASATDRAVGGISSRSASKSVNIYVMLTNNGSSTISNFTISYNVEKYRNGSNPAGFSIQMYYSNNGTNWTSAGDNFKTSFTADENSNGFASAPGATVSVTNKTLSVSLDPGNSLYLAWNYSVTSGSTTSNAQALGIDDVSIQANQSETPSISVNPTSLTGFSYVYGSGPSSEKSFSLTGSNLTSDLTVSISADKHFEISSTSGGTFGSSLSYTPTSGSVSATVYVRMKAGLEPGTYSTDETITCASQGATSQYVNCSGIVYKPEPANHVTNFICSSATTTSLTLTWSDASKYAPDGYLIKGSNVSFDAITAPVDGTPESDATLVKNVAQGTQTCTFSSLSENTTYYFKIYPYTNSGSAIDYKTDGNVPQLSASTLSNVYLNPGDIAILAFQSDNNDQFAFILLTDISGGTEVYFTDKGWTSTAFATNEQGVLTWTVPAGGLTKGTIIKATAIDANSTGWTLEPDNSGTISTSGAVQFAAAGDQIFVFQGSVSNPTFIYGMSSTTWLSKEEYDNLTSGIANYSCLPDGLINGSTAFAFPQPETGPWDNGYYNIETITGTKAEILNSIATADNWEFSETRFTSLPGWQYQEEQPPLPVVLTSFMAAISNQNYINLTWITQTETGMLGYYIMRNNTNDLATAQIVSPLIPAINSSQPKAYIYTDQEVTESGTYYYWLQANDLDGTIYILSFVSIEYNVTPGGTTPSIPLVTELNNVYPNPFNPQLFIPFSLANKSEVKIIIYNTRGQVVKDFVLGEKNAGNYRIEWDGTDNNGKAVPNGIYCIRMIAGKDYYQTKAILMK